ncbi:MAG: hypothetical protein NBV77_07635 [Bacteroidia bacterium]|nr:hypothetical protein [Bacteroidia bacterium]
MKWHKAISLLLLSVFLLGNQNLFHLHSEADHHSHEHAIHHHCEDFPENHQHLEENCTVCDYSLSQVVELNQPEQFEFEVYGVSFSADLQQSYSFDFFQIVKNKSPPVLSEHPFS